MAYKFKFREVMKKCVLKTLKRVLEGKKKSVWTVARAGFEFTYLQQTSGVAQN